MTAHQASDQQQEERNPTGYFLVGLARAFAGALVFSLPLLMTMEMWELGASLETYRIVVFMLVAIPLLVGLSYYVGFEETFSWRDDVIDAFVAYAVAFITSTVILWLLGVIHANQPIETILGMIGMQTVPGSIGALLAQSQLGVKHAEDRPQGVNAKYFGQLFLMVVGALFLALNLAPTEEIVLISYQMTEWQAVLLALLSLIIMHGFVYVVEFRGQETMNENATFWGVFLRYTVTGYALVLLISLYTMWTFGHTNGLHPQEIVMTMVVLSFPGAIGAAAARLIL